MTRPSAPTASASRVVLVGGGAAAATAARTLRRIGHTGPIAMLCGERVPPYSRPGLMYALMGHVRPRDLALHGDAAWTNLGIDRVARRATGLDVATRTLTLDDGAPLPYDRLLIATGSRPRRMGVPGEADDAGALLPGVVGFWGIGDLDAIVAAAAAARAAGRRAVVVGGGLSGVELCECLRWLGLEVTFLVREARVLARTFAPHESDVAEAALRHAGVDVRTGVAVVAIDRDASGVRGVTLSDGALLGCGLVGVTIGVAPDAAWLSGSGVSVDRGVRVDAALRVLGADERPVDDVTAAGDVAQLTSHGDRVEALWYTARAQGAVAAHALSGTSRPYAPGVPFNAAKVMHVEWQGVGAYDRPAPDGGADVVLRDGRRGGTLRLVADATGALTAVSAMGARIRLEPARAWIADRVPLDRALDRIGEIAFDAEFERRTFVSTAAVAA